MVDRWINGVNKSWVGLFGALMASALVLSACGGGDEGQPEGATVTINGSDPANPLIPGNTNESGGLNVLDNVFTGLVTYDPSTAAPENAVATEISTDDQQLWTIKLKEGWTFHDGTPVTADSFINAWNYVANGANGQINQKFLASVVGFEEIASEETPTSAVLSGLQKVNDYEFTVELSAPDSQFPLRLGYAAYYPLPDSFFADPAAFGQNPVGNGPFRFVSWDQGAAIELARYDDYQGTKPKVDGATIKIYQSLDAAYADLLAGNLDVLEQLPTSALAGGAFQTDLDGRVVEAARGSLEFILFPLYDPRFDDPTLREAFSLAIDRQTIIDTVFEGTREVATGWVAPVADGYKPGVCGEKCEFNPEQAVAKLTEAGGFDGELTIAYNADGGHQEWVEATCVSITNTLGVPCTGQASPDFPTYLEPVLAQQMTGAFRLEWIMDYPSIENFLAPVYSSGAEANVGGYSNPQFDELMTAGAQTAGSGGIEKFQEGETLLAQDMASLPMWYGKTVAGYSENVTDVQFTPFTRVDLSTIAVR